MGYNKGYIFKSSEEESEMSDAKEYWPYTDETTQGNIKISEDVIASIATIAVTETEGVASTAASMGVEITEMFAGRKNGAPLGVKILSDPEKPGCLVECSIILKFGASVTEVAKAVQKNVKNAVESMAGIPVASVDVQVCGIQLPKK